MTVIADFLEALGALGIHPIDPIIPDSDKILQVRIVGDKRKPGSLSYRLHTDAPASGYYNAWKVGVSGTWTQRSDSRLSPDDLSRMRREAEETSRRREAATARVKAAATVEAQ